jgi:hypothetical protein
MKGCRTLTNTFSTSTEKIIWFFTFILMFFWFSCVLPSLHPWDKSQMIVVYNLFDKLLDSVR